MGTTVLPGMKTPAITSALAVFVRTPERGPVKTRLASSWGQERATAFYSGCLECCGDLLRTLHDSGWDARWAVAETEGVGDARWREFPVIPQDSGGLGARMAGVTAELLASRPLAMIVGSDSPQLLPEHLDTARTLLHKADVVLGPSHDGGFWLLGMRHPIPRLVFESVEYSRDDTRASLVRALRRWKPDLRIREDLPVLRDVDTAEDAFAILPELSRTGAQRRLQAWLGEHSST